MKHRRSPLPVDGLDLSNDDLILNARQMCGWMGVSYVTWARWRVKGEGPPYIKASPRSFLYRVGDARRWMAARTRNAVEASA